MERMARWRGYGADPNSVTIRSDERECDSSCNCFFALSAFFVRLGSGLFGDPPAIILCYTNAWEQGAIWDHIGVGSPTGGSGPGGIAFGSLLLPVCTRFTFKEFAQNLLHPSSGERKYGQRDAFEFSHVFACSVYVDLTDARVRHLRSAVTIKSRSDATTSRRRHVTWP